MRGVLHAHDLLHLLRSVLVEHLVLLDVRSSPLVFDSHKLLSLIKLVLRIDHSPCQVLGLPIGHSCR